MSAAVWATHISTTHATTLTHTRKLLTSARVIRTPQYAHQVITAGQQNIKVLNVVEVHMYNEPDLDVNSE